MTPLRQKYIRDLTIRGKAENTQQVYTACVADLASYYKRSPDLLSYDQVADWLFHLRDERKLASSSVNIAVRPWTNVAWLFLTIGIALGSWWAYYELGWGGWWFWDSVENASFMAPR